MKTKQTPLIELLERVPQDARVVVEHDQFSSSSHPVGRLCHEAAAALRAALAQEQADEPQRPKCFEFALDFLGAPESVELRAYIEQLEGRAALAQEQAEPVAWLQPKTVDAQARPDLGYETCSSADYGAFPVYRAPPKAEQAQEPVAVVGTQVDVWRGCDGRWAPPGGPIKTALMLKDMPVGTMLYTTPPKRQPLAEEEIDAEWRELDVEASALFKRVIRKFARAVERAHGIGEQP